LPEAKVSESGNGRKATNAQQSVRIWKRIPGLKIAGFLQAIRFPEEARDMNGELLASFIKEQIPMGSLTEWTVAVLAGDEEAIRYGGQEFKTAKRTGILRKKVSSRYVVKTILNPPDEAIDLDEDELREALALTNRKRANDGLEPKSHPDGPEIRSVRGIKPKRGLLLIYPLSPKAANLPDLDFPIFGIVVSFPDAKDAKSVWYDFGTVAQRLDRQ